MCFSFSLVGQKAHQGWKKETDQKQWDLKLACFIHQDNANNYFYDMYFYCFIPLLTFLKFYMRLVIDSVRPAESQNHQNLIICPGPIISISWKKMHSSQSHTNGRCHTTSSVKETIEWSKHGSMQTNLYFNPGYDIRSSRFQLMI